MELREMKGFKKIITVDPRMLKMLDIARRVARSTSKVLITGESGTGKELVARGIHDESPRSNRPFVAVNCGAIPRELLESELMGYERGAFTGAVNRKTGDFEIANGGTIFLDEISSLPLPLQAKLLRVLQEREIKRLGSTKTIKLDVRIISATNVNLKEEADKGLFRHDLYFRLHVVPIHLPPLRDRKGDIPILLNHFIKKASEKLNQNIPGYSSEIVPLFERCKWRGNIRELENIVERIVVLAGDGITITVKDLPEDIVLPDRKEYNEIAEDVAGLKERCMVYEKGEIMKELYATKWNMGETAQNLKIHRNTLIQKMKKLDIPSGYKKGDKNISF